MTDATIADRIKTALRRRTQQREIIKAEQQQRIDDDVAIEQVRKRLKSVQISHSVQLEMIRKREDDLLVARQRLAELNQGIPAMEAELEQYRQTAAPLAQELRELRELLLGADDLCAPLSTQK